MAAPRAIYLYNRQRKVRFDMNLMQAFAPVALTECEREGIAEMHPLSALPEIEVTIVSDRVIDKVHRRFMNIPGATDVITFEYGEIVISAETAARQAAELGLPLESELGLYIIHGILHLNGHDDLSEPAATHMKAAQARILDRVLERMRLDP